MQSREPRHLPLLLIVPGVALLTAGSALWMLATALDRRIFNLMKLSVYNDLAPVAAGLSTVGGIAFLGPLAFAVVLWLAYRRRRAEALWLLLTIASGRLTTEALKLGFEKARPPLDDRLALVTSYSFPSSHSAGSMLTSLAIATLFISGHRWRLLPVLAFPCAVGWSRMALGVHWPSDVLAGLGFGMLWVGVAARWYPARPSVPAVD